MTLKQRFAAQPVSFKLIRKPGSPGQNLGERLASPLPVFPVNVTAAAAGRLWTFFATKDPGQVRHRSG